MIKVVERLLRLSHLQLQDLGAIDLIAVFRWTVGGSLELTHFRQRPLLRLHGRLGLRWLGGGQHVRDSWHGHHGCIVSNTLLVPTVDDPTSRPRAPTSYQTGPKKTMAGESSSNKSDSDGEMMMMMLMREVRG